jgi:hypothetical protein
VGMAKKAVTLKLIKKTENYGNVVYDVLKQHIQRYEKPDSEGKFWFDYPPEEWNEDQAREWEMLHEVEDKIMDHVKKVLMEGIN